MEKIPEPNLQSVPNLSEKPVIHLPKIRYRSSAEDQHLPFSVTIDPQALGSVMQDMGFSGHDIDNFTVTASYRDPPLETLLRRTLGRATRGFAFMGSAHPLSGDLTIRLKPLELRALETYRQTLRTLEGKPEIPARSDIAGDIIDFVINGSIPGLTDKSHESNLSDPGLLDQARHISGELGPDRAKAFLQDELKILLEKQLRYLLPHELTHARQIQRGATFVNVATGVATLTLYNAVWSRLMKQVYRRVPLRKLTQVKHNMFSAAGMGERVMKNAVFTAMGTVWSAGYLRCLAAVRSVTGFDAEAEKAATDLSDRFRSVISIRPASHIPS